MSLPLPGEVLLIGSVTKVLIPIFDLGLVWQYQTHNTHCISRTLFINHVLKTRASISGLNTELVIPEEIQRENYAGL